MRKVLLVLGAVLLIGAAVLLVRAPGEALGSFWASIDSNSLVGFGALVEKEIDPDLWLDVVLPVLEWPAWVLPGALGLILVLLVRPWSLGRRKAEPATTV